MTCWCGFGWLGQSNAHDDVDREPSVANFDSPQWTHLRAGWHYTLSFGRPARRLQPCPTARLVRPVAKGLVQGAPPIGRRLG
jgi:hypothetical protein